MAASPFEPPFQTVWETNPDGSNAYQSPAWYRYTGEAEGGSHGEGWLRFYHPDDRAFLSSEWQRALSAPGSHPYDIVVRIRRHDGEFRWFRVQGTPLRNADGTVRKWVGTCTDVHDEWHARKPRRAAASPRARPRTSRLAGFRLNVLERRLFLTVLAGMLPIALLLSGVVVLSAQTEKRVLLQAAADTSRAVMTAVDGELNSLVASLDALAASPRLRGGDLAAFHAEAREFMNRRPGIVNGVLSTPDAEQRLNARREWGSPLAESVDAESARRAASSGAPVYGRLVDRPPSGPVFSVRIPVLTTAGDPLVLTAVVTPNRMLGVIMRQRIPEGGVVSILDGYRQIVARSLNHRQWVGKGPSPSFMALLEQSGGNGYGTTRTLEGSAVYSVLHRSPASGWIVSIGIPEALVDAPVARSYLVLGGSFLLSLVLGLGASFLMARRITQPMAELEAAAIDVGQGRAPTAPRTDLPQVRTAADALAAAHAEREKLLQREREARHLAEDANRSKDEFLAMLGHELRNPLASIATAAQVLRRSEDRAVAMQAADIVARQSAHLGRMTDDLLDAGRVMMGKISLFRGPVDLAEVAREQLATLRSSGKLDRHRVETDLKPAWVDGDPTRLDQVVGNLVGNALKYTPPGGLIAVTVYREGVRAVLRVKDSGVGLDPELATRVFDLFVQGRIDPDRSKGGLGIGLTLVRRLTELHGGSVEVSSQGQGKGTEFSVALPVIEAPERPATPDAPRGELVPHRVVIVEDNLDARLTLRHLLELEGHTVHEAADGPAGVSTILEVKPDIAFIDIGLPVFDGYRVARAVRERAGEPPYLVALSGYGNRDSAPAGAEFDEYIVKPLDPETLHRIVRESPPLPR